MISKSEQELLFMMMDLQAKVKGVEEDHPNLAYVDLRVSGIMTHPSIFKKLQENFAKTGITLTMIIAKKACATWFRFRHV